MHEIYWNRLMSEGSRRRSKTSDSPELIWNQPEFIIILLDHGIFVKLSPKKIWREDRRRNRRLNKHRGQNCFFNLYAKKTAPVMTHCLQAGAILINY